MNIAFHLNCPGKNIIAFVTAAALVSPNPIYLFVCFLDCMQYVRFISQLAAGRSRDDVFCRDS